MTQDTYLASPRQAPPRRDFPASAPIVDLAPHRIADAVIDNDISELDPDTRDFIRGVGWGCVGGSAFWGLVWVVWRLV